MPRMLHWRFSSNDMEQLHGVVFGDYRMEDGKTCCTSPIVKILKMKDGRLACFIQDNSIFILDMNDERPYFKKDTMEVLDSFSPPKAKKSEEKKIWEEVARVEEIDNRINQLPEWCRGNMNPGEAIVVLDSYGAIVGYYKGSISVSSLKLEESNTYNLVSIDLGEKEEVLIRYNIKIQSNKRYFVNKDFEGACKEDDDSLLSLELESWNPNLKKLYLLSVDRKDLKIFGNKVLKPEEILEIIPDMDTVAEAIKVHKRKEYLKMAEKSLTAFRRKLIEMKTLDEDTEKIIITKAEDITEDCSVVLVDSQIDKGDCINIPWVFGMQHVPSNWKNILVPKTDWKKIMREAKGRIKNLVIEAELSQEDFDFIEEMDEINYLVIYNAKNLKNINFIEKLLKLTNLEIYKNQISDIAPLHRLYEAKKIKYDEYKKANPKENWFEYSFDPLCSFYNPHMRIAIFDSQISKVKVLENDYYNEFLLTNNKIDRTSEEYAIYKALQDAAYGISARYSG